MLCLRPSSHIFLSLRLSACGSILPAVYCRLRARSVSLPRVLYLESYDVETTVHLLKLDKKWLRLCVQYFCWMMRELRKHMRRKIVPRKRRVPKILTFEVVQFFSYLSVFTSQPICVIPPPLSSTSSSWYLCSHQHGWQRTLSFPLFLLSAISHSESMFTSNHMMPPCLSPSICVSPCSNKQRNKGWGIGRMW